MQAKIFSNALWNAVNGSSSAVVAVLVPPFLTRLLTPEAYGAWALALQIGTYVALFGFGIQMAVARYVAFHETRDDIPARDGIVITAFWFLAAASTIGWIAICCVALLIERLVPNLSTDLIGQTQIAIVLVGLALAVNLPSAVFAAVFTGLQRSDVPAKIQGVGRLILAVSLVVAGLSRNLAILGLAYALISIGTVLALAYAWRTRTHVPRLSPRFARGEYARELASFCFSLTLWNLAMLMVSGLDLIIVGRYDYASTAFFAVSVTLTTLVAGTLSSLANALVPAAAGLPEDPSGEHLLALLTRSSRLIIAAAILVAMPLALSGRTILALWLTEDYARHAAPILAMLVWATLIRNAMLPYVTIAIGIGYQRKMTLTPLMEGVISVAASVILVQSLGAYGVAIAKVIGGLCGVLMIVGQHPLRQPLGGVSRASFLVENILRPGASLLPILLVFALAKMLISNDFAILLCVSLATLASVWLIALQPQDRDFARTKLKR